MKIFFSVGEPSGDLHGANLIRQLRARRPDIECVGYGGPQMAAAGCTLHADLTQLAVMWFARVLVNLHKFWRLVAEATRYFQCERPDAVVLIDYPGFNWWIARRAKARGIPVFYYTPPQIWAWGQWRARKMRQFVDHVLCSLPFEAAWFQQRGCHATFVGHPLFDEVTRKPLDARFLAEQRTRPGRLVTILPGSRTQEVEHNLLWLLKAASAVKERVGDARFAVASFKPQQADMVRRMIVDHAAQTGAAQTGGELPIEVFVGRTPELIHAAECCLAVSGSVSLELLYHAKPTVILYWISRLAFFVQSWFKKVKYITLVNLLSAKELYPRDVTPYDPASPDAQEAIFPEYLTSRDKSGQMAAHVIAWLNDPVAKAAVVARLETLKRQVAHGGASARAAEYILTALSAPHCKAADAIGGKAA